MTAVPNWTDVMSANWSEVNPTPGVMTSADPFLSEVIFWVTWLSIVSLAFGGVTNTICLAMSFNVDSDSSTVAWVRWLAVIELIWCLDFLRYLLSIEGLDWLSHSGVKALCYFFPYVNGVVVMCGNTFYCLLTMDRAVAVTLPIFYKNRCKRDPAMLLGLLVVIALFLLLSPLAVWRVWTPEGACYLNSRADTYLEWVNNIYGSVFPVVTIIPSSVIIMYKVMGRRKEGEKVSSGEKRLAFLVIGMGTCCITSILLGNASTIVYNSGAYGQAGVIFAYVAGVLLGALNSSTNLLFYWVSPLFRRAIRRTFRRVPSP